MWQGRVQVQTCTANVEINMQSSGSCESIHLKTQLYHSWTYIQKILPQGHLLNCVQSGVVHKRHRLLYLGEIVLMIDVGRFLQ